MAYDLEEQEQLAQIKAWWERWGNLVLTAATVVLLGFAAFNGWRWYERHEAGNAAALYEEFLGASDGARRKELAGTLIERFGSTVYAPMAALQVAKVNYESGDAGAARAQLQWVIEKSGHDELAQIARLRLAGVMLDAKSYDEALKLLSADVPAVLAVAYADRRGDVLMAMTRPEEARAAYKEALDKADAQHPLRPIIQLKLDALPAAAS